MHVSTDIHAHHLPEPQQQKEQAFHTRAYSTNQLAACTASLAAGPCNPYTQSQTSQHLAPAQGCEDLRGGSGVQPRRRLILQHYPFVRCMHTCGTACLLNPLQLAHEQSVQATSEHPWSPARTMKSREGRATSSSPMFTRFRWPPLRQAPHPMSASYHAATTNIQHSLPCTNPLGGADM